MERKKPRQRPQTQASGAGEPPKGKTAVGTGTPEPGRVEQTMQILRSMNPTELRQVKEGIVNSLLS